MQRILLFLLCPAALSAQFLSFGIKGGVPLTNAFDAVRTGDIEYISDTKRYVVGGAAELRFPLGLGVEFNALYRRLSYESVQPQDGAQVGASTRANAWEFPLLFKLRAPSPLVRPYFVAGPTFRHLSGLRQFVTSPIATIRGESRTPAELENRFSAGFAVGGGLEIGGRLRLAPEIRYTRWGRENFRSPTAPGFQSNLNQLDFLLGIHF